MGEEYTYTRTFEPEEIPEIELKPVNFNDLFGG